MTNNPKGISGFFQNIPGSQNIYIDVDSKITDNGDLLELYNIDVIVNGLSKMLMTEKGTYMFNPTYGVGLQKYLFEKSSENTRRTIESEILQSCYEYAPSVTVEVSVLFFPNERGFSIDLTVFYENKNRKITLPYTRNMLKTLGS